MSARLFIQDCVELAARNVGAGRLDRRTFLKGCAAFGAAPLLLSGREAAAKPSQVVHANWGGDAVRCFEEVYGKAFTERTGVKAVIDGSGPLEGNIKAMVESGAVTWDCCDGDFFNILRLGRQGMLEPIDYSIVDRNAYLAPYTHDYGVLGYWYSYVLTWDREKLGDVTPTWADFFDVERIPGKRTLYKWMNGAVEAALLADGVPPDQLYPLDLDRAFDKIESIKDHLLFWGSGAESQQMFLQGEVVMGELWHTRSSQLEKDTQGRVAWTWDQGNAAPAAWIIPKGNPAGAEWANRWIAHLADPALQIGAMECFGQGPANPAANDIMPEELRRLHPALPENLSRQIPLDSEYFAAHYDDALNGYLDVISA